MSQETELTLADLNFSYDPSIYDYYLDALQNQLLNFYLRADPRFAQAYSMDFTRHFIQFLKDKAKLKEPIHISILGVTRSGKSYTALAICIIHSLLNGRQFTAEYICANEFEYLEKVQSMPKEKLINSIFLIDEAKNTAFGSGSVAKRLKLTDVQNIIAINNISTISLTPDRFSNEKAFYGLRSFGKAIVKAKPMTDDGFPNYVGISRFMLYNLQEGSNGLPMGMVYIPIFTRLLPKNHAERLEKEYLDRKNDWVMKEMRGEGDVLMEMKKKSAENFLRDESFMGLKKKDEKVTYISMVLGSEWTKGEVLEIYNLIEIMRKGIKFEKNEDAQKVGKEDIEYDDKKSEEETEDDE